MGWEFSTDVEPWAERVEAVLAADPVRHTLALTVLHGVRGGRRWSDQPMLFGWCTDGAGAVFWTPPHELSLALVPAGTVGALVAALRARGSEPPEVAGDPALVEEFRAAWGGGGRLVRKSRLYALDVLRPPSPPPPGAPGAAGADDLDLAVRWGGAFEAEVSSPSRAATAVVRRLVDDGRLWLWHDAGRPVAMAGRSPTAAGVTRIGPVYTPPEHRRRGYGSAVTAACTADALARGAAHVVLFTDLANPTANKIYQEIGYHPRRDRHIVRFATDPP
jgi:GNAT superfamily N-acetyltransferase